MFLIATWLVLMTYTLTLGSGGLNGAQWGS